MQQLKLSSSFYSLARPHPRLQELGDPCCVWAANGSPPTHEAVSHPGSSVSTAPAAAGTARRCPPPAAAAAPASPTFFKAGEAQLSTDLRAPSLLLPPAYTAYYVLPFAMPFDVSKETVTIVGVEALLDSPRVHHFLVFLCPPSAVIALKGPDGFELPDGCADLVYGWAPGQGPLATPQNAGFRMGKGTNLTQARVNGVIETRSPWFCDLALTFSFPVPRVPDCTPDSLHKCVPACLQQG